jgi:hypothetical protein
MTDVTLDEPSIGLAPPVPDWLGRQRLPNNFKTEDTEHHGVPGTP